MRARSAKLFIQALVLVLGEEELINVGSFFCVCVRVNFEMTRTHEILLEEV